MAKSLDIEFEEAVRLLVEFMPPSDENIRKPILAHDIRVSAYLFENNYSREIILAGLLHDALEWSGITEEMIEKEFGENVLKLVKANTKDRSIQNSDERIDESVKRCAENGEDALIVKTADILDSFKYYTKVNNQAGLEYCRKNAEAIKKYKAEDFVDLIFEKLNS
jgi:guanosine-3',5'-bis(diphosphate) 3'-pyrophosphohydrolase